MRQFVSHVTARVDAADQRRAEAALPAGARALFSEMPVADRRHAIEVAGRLASRGHRDPDLIAAALLHDAAKGHHMRVWHRIAGVVLGAAAPAVLRRLAAPDVRSWRYPFFLYLEHDRLSAEAAAAAGCSARTAAFIRGDVSGTDRPLLAAFREADRAS